VRDGLAELAEFCGKQRGVITESGTERGSAEGGGVFAEGPFEVFFLN